MGVRIIQGLPRNKKDVAFYWEDSDKNSESVDACLINKNCSNITKTFVDDIHNLSFGHGMAVDPKFFVGEMVCKSIYNGEHDGKIITGPVKTIEENKVYQIAIRNYLNNEHQYVCDIRVPIFEGNIYFLYIKIRPTESRFSNTNTEVRIVKNINLIFSETELKQIRDFASNMNCEYGELDILKDINTKKIFVVDVNKTPLGPPNGLSKRDNKLAIQMYKSALSKLFKI